MDRDLNLPSWEPAPPTRVEYYPEGQVLFIENGRQGVVGEEMAENVIVHYDKDDSAFASVIAIRIDSAEHVLKPFVDAILAKYGVKRESETTDGQAQDHIGVPGN